MGENHQPGPGDDREPLVLAETGPARGVGPVPLAAIGAALAALIWFACRMSPGAAFGPWQGALLAARPLERVPVVAHAVFLACSPFPNATAALFGAVACGLLGALAAAVLHRRGSGIEAVAGGLAAGVLFAVTPAMTYASTATGPAVVSIALALAALALSAGTGERGRPRVCYAAAAAAGLGMANHAALGLLAFLVLPAGVLRSRSSGERWRVLLFAAATFMATASLPLLQASWQGEGIRAFLAHALAQPFPFPLSARPDAGFPLEALAQVPVEVALFALPGVAWLIHPRTRRAALVLLAALALFGPLLPSVTHQATAGPDPVDAASPLLVAMAALSFFVACGMACMARLLTRDPKHAPARAAVVVVLAVLGVALAWPEAPSRRHDLAGALGRAILDSCPDDAVLLTGDADLTSLALAVQHLERRRLDVTVAPVAYLAQREAVRARLAARIAGAARVDGSFPPEDAQAAWPVEQPVLFARFLRQRRQGRGDSSALTDLALWEFIRQNHAQRPLCFVGRASPWLAARGRASGAVLVYPAGTATPVADPLAALDALLSSPRLLEHNPGAARTVASVLLPLVQAAHAQAEAQQEHARLGQWAAMLAPTHPRFLLEQMRAMARRGDKEGAMAHAAQYLWHPQARHDVDALRRLVEEEMTGHALEQRFKAVLARERLEDPDYEARQAAAGQLWGHDEIHVLAREYVSLLEARPKDLDALYQLAAAQAQFGRFDRARDLLERWAKASRLPPGRVAERLDGDGRFVLLQTARTRDSAGF